MDAIVIASQDEVIREELKTILSSSYKLIVVESAAECLSALSQKSAIGLVFLQFDDEQDLEERRGLMGSLRKLRPNTTQIVIGSNEEDEDLAVQSVAWGATGYMMLPLKKNDILATAAKTIKR